MSDTNNGAKDPLHQLPPDNQQATLNSGNHEADLRLAEALTRAMQLRAAQVHFSPDLRENILDHLPSRHTGRAARLLPGLAVALAVLLIFSAGFIVWFPPHSPLPSGQAFSYQVKQKIPVPAQFARGVNVVSLDPTGHHLVYQPTSQPDVMYTMDLIDPLASNVLAMRAAHGVSWAPDGSALVTVVTTPGTAQPRLALVPFGKYMSSLGQEAQAVDWEPQAEQSITYVTQEKGPTALWATTRAGQAPHLLATMALTLPVQQMLWSPDGKHLALVVAEQGQSGSALLNQPGKAIYLMDKQSGRLQVLVAPGDFTIGSIGWSPDSSLLTYERVATSGEAALQTIDIVTERLLLNISLQGPLAGWSWSSDSHTLVYSDGGRLLVRTLSGPTVVLPTASVSQTFPFWLRDGRLLVLQATTSGESLVLLTRTT